MINPLKPGRVFGAGVIIFMTAVILISAPVSRAALCKRWSEGEKAGTLDHLQIDEASGIAVSSRLPGRLYHVNDSGSG
ncbi:MAG TPA: hypothetical protein VLG45_08870, partial [Thermodesulfobacteriota bacterium]|nr:hypothetical protein [Thermodesulfobacteriota bacterium]